MKNSIFFGLSLIISGILNAQQIHVINQGSGNSFSPSDVTVNQGDIVRFNLSASHPVAQVSQGTWNANGTTLLPGGFSFPTGSGDYTATTPGTIYFVCQEHVGSDAMKGIITVNAITGINDIHLNGAINVFPNPAMDFINYLPRDNNEFKEIRILDLTGKTVKILQKNDNSDGKVRIYIGNLDKGIYFIIIKYDNGIESGKFLKS